MAERTPRPAPGTPITDPDVLDFTAYGDVHATMVGEDSDRFIALGHGDPTAIIKAFRRAALGAGWTKVDLRQLDTGRLEQRYGRFTAHREFEWWCDWSATKPAPELIAVTVLEL